MQTKPIIPRSIPTILRRMEALFGDYPQTELNYKTPFQLLVAVMLSAQTTDIQVNKVTQSLFKVVHTPRDVVALGENNLKQFIKTVWLHVSKTKHIYRTACVLAEKPAFPWSPKLQTDIKKNNVTYQKSAQIQHIRWYRLPDTIEEMIKLPGVGIKTAKVVLSVLYGQRWIAVDTHVHRVMHRLWIVKWKNPEQTSKELETTIPDHYKQQAHRLIIYFGRYLCKAQRPDCDSCPLVKRCVRLQWGKK
jgi:endonuclease-3